MSAFDNISFKKIANLTLRADNDFMIFCKRKSQDYYLSSDDIHYICEILPMVADLVIDWSGIEDENDNELPFTKENCYLALQQSNDLLEFIIDKSNDFSNFQKIKKKS